MVRFGEKRGCRSDFRQLPGVHDREMIDELSHETHVVTDEDNRNVHFALQTSDGLHHLSLDDDVEGAGGFVGDDHLWTKCHGDGNADALLHATREFVGIEARDLRTQFDRFEHLDDPRLNLRIGQVRFVHLQDVLDLRPDPNDWVQCAHGCLWHHADQSHPRTAHLIV